MLNNRITGAHFYARSPLGLLAFIILIAVFLHGCAHKAGQNCIEHRAAFDIGSATMKIKTAKVDTCSNINLGLVFQKEVKVAFSENTRNQQLSTDIQNKGLEQLSLLKGEAQTRGAKKFAGVATAAFRQADNTPQFLDNIKDKTGISVKLISQDEEAILGYKAATAFAPDEPIVVWDIGGNSMQIIAQDSSGQYIIYRGKTASVSFKNLILEKISRKSEGVTASPNPIGRQNLTAALDIAVNTAQDIPSELQKCMRQKEVKIVGIGGVHNQSVRKQVNASRLFTRDDLAQTLNNRIEWTDAQIGGHYADTDISNLILVLGFMKKLDIDRVYLKDVNLTDGLLMEASVWQ